jgi:membrane associated rhomboid family serine protease
MGIYDREYYRDETGSRWFSGPAPATRLFILINVGVFLLQWIARGLNVPELMAASSYEIFAQGHVWQLLTAAFLHVEPLHLLFNMLVLWWVGREVEEMLGTTEFACFYLTAAVLSTLAWASIDAFAIRSGAPMLGASGAVMAIFVYYAILYPRREILLFFVLPMPMWLVLTIFLGLDLIWLLEEFRGPQGAGVAFASHLGGALFGFVYHRTGIKLSRLSLRRAFRPRLRMVHPERDRNPRGRDRDSARPAPARPSRSMSVPHPSGPGSTGPATIPFVFEPEQLDQRLDEVLAKIAREGRDHLTDEDQAVLQEASRRARDRRGEPTR